MRRETRDELLLGFLAINAMLREEVRGLRRTLEQRTLEHKYNPNWAKQPRAPKGTTQGGQWIDGGSSGKVRILAQPRPAEPLEQQPQHQRQPMQRLPNAANDNAPTAANDTLVRFSLSRGPLTAVTLPFLLYGDTPPPTIRTLAVDGTDDLFLVETELLDERRFVSFQRIERPERRVPAGLLAPITGFEAIEPAELRVLPVRVEVEGDEVIFDGQELARAYGRDIPGVTRAIGREPSQFGPITYTWEEADMVLSMRQLGRTPQQIQAALDDVRHSRAAFRNNPGRAFSSEPLRVVRQRWLGPTTVESAVPEQVAAQLRGRVFANADEFRYAFWKAVANSDLASQFNSRDLYVMSRFGYAPDVEDEREWYGGLTTYIIHHRRTIASGGPVFDMSNMLIVTPSRHQDILPPSEHFAPSPRRRRGPND